MKKYRQGFTLIEAVMVIAITGAIAAGVAIFIRDPVLGYLAAARRAELTDIADTAARRFSRDVRLALPNSIRLATSGPAIQSIEFLSTRTGGRYRVEQSGGTGDILDFTVAADNSFDVLGTVDMVTGDKIVVYNLGITGADAYDGTSLRAYSGATATGLSSVPFTATAAAFPFDSPIHSFQVVDTPVTYKCDTTAATLTRYSGYPIAAAQAITPPSGGALMAKNVTQCVFKYEAGITERTGLVSMRLSITEDNETVTLYHDVHVSNVP